jgi:hypothetical protein
MRHLKTRQAPFLRRWSARGAVKKEMTKATYICRSVKKKVVTYRILYFIFIFIFIFYRFFLRAFFGRFVTRGVQKHEKKLFFEKVHLGSSQKMRLFFPPFFFFFSLGCFVRFFFIAFLGVW